MEYVLYNIYTPVLSIQTSPSLLEIFCNKCVCVCVRGVRVKIIILRFAGLRFRCYD